MATASPAGPGLSPGLGSPGGPIIKSGIVAFRSPDMQDFEPRYLELMQGKLKLRRHRRGRVIRSYILQDQECLFSELRDQPRTLIAVLKDARLRDDDPLAEAAAFAAASQESGAWLCYHD